MSSSSGGHHRCFGRRHSLRAANAAAAAAEPGVLSSHAADDAGDRDKFTGTYAHRVSNGVGHNVPQDAPQAFAQAMSDLDAFCRGWALDVSVATE
jgi:hypothetical protein